MAYKVDIQVQDTKIIALIMNDHGEELFRGEFGYHLEDRDRMVEQVTKGTEATLLQLEKIAGHEKEVNSKEILV